jgi:hypothetical protein
MRKAWEAHIKKPLTTEQRDRVLAEVAREVAEIEADVRLRRQEGLSPRHKSS